MTLREIKEKLLQLPEGERAAVVRQLFENFFCDLSKRTLIMWQQTYALVDSGDDFSRFVQEQNKIVLECIDYETSEVGKIVREALKLQPLSLDTEIEIYSEEKEIEGSKTQNLK